MTNETSKRYAILFGRSPYGVLVVGLLTWTLLCARIDRGAIGNAVDDGIYFVSAVAMSEGQGYTLPSRPGNPYATKYPIGLPTLTALALNIAPFSTIRAKYAVGRTIVIISGWIFAFACAAFIRRIGLSRLTAAVVPLAVLLHPGTLQESIMLMSDLPFLAIVMVLLLRVTRVSEEPGRHNRDCFFDGLLAGLAMLVRSNGISLVVAAALATLMLGFKAPREGTRGRLAGFLACLLGVTLILTPAKIYDHAFPGPRDTSGYAFEIRAAYGSFSAFGIISHNVMCTIRICSQVLLAQILWSTPGARLFASPLRALLVAIPSLFLIAMGLLKVAARQPLRYLPHWTHGLLTLVIFLIWPWELCHRFLLPILPFLLILMGIGLQATLKNVTPNRMPSVEAWPAMFSLLGSLAVVAGVVTRASRSNWTWGGANAGQDQVLNFVRDHTEPNAVLISYIPETMFLYAHRLSIPVIEDADVVSMKLGRWNQLDRWLKRCAGRPLYFAGDAPGASTDFEARQVAALMKSNPGRRIEPLFRSSDGKAWVARLVE